MELSINGQTRQLPDEAVDPAMPLLWALRDVLNLTGTKFGCGVAACGACTVMVDGRAVRSCVMPVGAVRGHAVRTIESLGRPEQQRAPLHSLAPGLRGADCGACSRSSFAAVLIASRTRP